MTAAAATQDRAREFDFGPAEHAVISKLAYEEAGIVLPAGKMQLVYGRLARRVRACRLTSFADYIALIDQDAAERARAVDALTTNHTKFFREDHHFEHFLETTWPPLERRLAAGGSVRLWSAACSSGEEPYTLAMAILGADKTRARRILGQDLKILATDLSPSIIEAARTARYARDGADAVPPALRSAWMRRSGDMFEVDPELRKMVTFRELNLLGPWPIRQSYEAIFCRNVMIYFDEPTKDRLQTRFSEKLVPGGFLYIGHSERLATPLSASFRCVGRTIFQKALA